MLDFSSNHRDHQAGEIASAPGGTISERTYVSSASTVVAAARAVVAFALESGIGPACRARIGGAVAEIVDNAARRAYPCGGGRVHVRAEIEGREFVVTVQDHGVGFDMELVDDELLSHPLHSGLARAMALCEGLHVESKVNVGTRVVMRFVPASIAFDEGGAVDLSDHDFLTPDVARRVLHALRRHETAHIHQFSPALAVVVGRLLSGPEPRSLVERALWS